MTTPEITLDPMTDEEYAAWLEPSIRHYAEENVQAGRNSAEDAAKAAQAEFAKLLPDGARTKDQHLYTVRDAASGAGVGVLWIALRPKAGVPEAFVYDIEIAEDHRGRGYGRAAMLACAERARELGARSVGLHVFGHNTAARELYKSLGFVETNVNMSLQLSGDDA